MKLSHVRYTQSPIIHIEAVPLGLDLRNIRRFMHIRLKPFSAMNIMYWGLVTGFSFLCMIAAYQIITTELFISCH